MNKAKLVTLIKLSILFCFIVQGLTPALAAAETKGTSNEKKEETTESSIPKLSESLDRTLEKLTETSETGSTIAEETEALTKETEEKQQESVIPEVKTFRSPRSAPYLEVSSINRQPSGSSHIALSSISVSTKSPWTLNFSIYCTSSSNPIGIEIYNNVTGINRIYYQQPSGTYTNIEVELPTELRGQLLYCAAAFQYSPASGNQKAAWHYHSPTRTTYTTIAYANGSVTPNRPMNMSAHGTVVSGSASFSLNNLTFSGSVAPRVYFFEDRNQAAANPPNLSSHTYADCGVSGNTIYFNDKALLRGKTYYYRFVIATNYTDITIYSAFNDDYRITMPDVTLHEANMNVSIRNDGLALNASIPYSLVDPFEGAATVIDQANSRIRFYNSLANAGTITNMDYEVIPDIDPISRLMYKNNYTSLVAGKEYWYRFGASTNYLSTYQWTLPDDSRKITMPKLTLSAPTINPVGTSGTINAAVTSALVGTGASYPANASKVYIFDSEQKANNKETASRVLEGNLAQSGGQMMINNLSGLTPGKKYWARFYVSSNYTAINQWSAVVPFSIPYAVNEEYYDLSGTHIKNETVTISDGSSYQPSKADFNHSSTDYVYYGWLNASEIPGVDTPRNSTFTANSNATIKLIYLDKNSAFLLRSVPKFDFGTVTASNTHQDYQLDANRYGGSTADLSVEYLDKRPTSTGWSLKAQMSELEMVQSPSDKLTNAKLTMSRKMQVLTAANTWSDSLPGGVTDYGGGTVTLIAGGSEVNVLSSGTASAADCSGNWRNLIDFDSVKLNVQGSTALAGANYSGKVTWTLDNTP